MWGNNFGLAEQKQQMLRLWWGLWLIVPLLPRLVQFWHNRSFWLDEAFLGLNIQQRDWLGLLQPLAYHQGAPLGFLLPSKGLYSLFGTDWSLRLLPLVASVMTVVLALLITRRLMPLAVPLVMGLLATSEWHLYYTSEFKQYSLDAMLALAVVWGVLWFDDQPHRARWWALTIGGALAVWFSHPIIFVMAGAGLALLWRHRHQRHRLGALVLMGAVWLTSFALVYALVYYPLSLDSHLRDYWAGRYVVLDSLTLLQVLYEVFLYVAGQNQWMLMVLAMAGLVIAMRTQKAFPLLLMLLPIVITLVASLFELYPFQGRLILFFNPALTIACALGITELVRQIARANFWVAVAMSVMLAVALLTRTPYIQERMEVRDLVADVMAQAGNPMICCADLSAGLIGQFYGYQWQDAQSVQAIDAPVWVIVVTTPEWQLQTEALLAQWQTFAIPQRQLTGVGVLAIEFYPKP